MPSLLEADVLASKLFHMDSIHPDDLRQRVRSLYGDRPRGDALDIPVTAETRRILDLAQEETNRRAVKKVTSEDILAAVLRTDMPLSRLLLASGLRIDEVRQAATVERP